MNTLWPAKKVNAADGSLEKWKGTFSIHIDYSIPFETEITSINSHILLKRKLRSRYDKKFPLCPGSIKKCFIDEIHPSSSKHELIDY